MTHTTEILLNVALCIWAVCIVTFTILFIKKNFGVALGFRFKDRVWSNLDDHRERIAMLEIAHEMNKPANGYTQGNPLMDRHHAMTAMDIHYNEGKKDGKREELKRVLEILEEHFKVIDNSVYNSIKEKMTLID